MANESIRRTWCDWCGIHEDIPFGKTTESRWVRIQVRQLVHSETAQDWEICPHCWSLIEARRLSLKTEAKAAGRTCPHDEVYYGGKATS